MTQDEIIELARQALKQEPREDWNSTAWVFADETLEAFAKLVAEKAVAYEREACAKDAEWCIQNYIEQHIPERIRARNRT